jgi:hypothetical protein
MVYGLQNREQRAQAQQEEQASTKCSRAKKAPNATSRRRPAIRPGLPPCTLDFRSLDEVIPPWSTAEGCSAASPALYGLLTWTTSEAGNGVVWPFWSINTRCFAPWTDCQKLDSGLSFHCSTNETEQHTCSRSLKSRGQN